MRIVFIGASGFGLRALRVVKRLPSCELVGVVTAPRKFAISYRPEGVTNVLHAEIDRFAAESGVPCLSIGRSMSDSALLAKVMTWNPDAFIVVGWYHMIPKSWREIAPAYGLHASLLPDYSGGAPLVWAMINGESRTGVTLFKMDDGVDTGPIVGQTEEVIETSDTIATLYERIEKIGLQLLQKELPRLANGTAVIQDQPTTGRRVMPQRSPEDGLIDWTKGSQFIERFVRAQTRPYPGAYTMRSGERVLIWVARDSKSKPSRLPVGSIIHSEGKCFVVCGQGALGLHEIEIDGLIYAGENILSELPQGAILK